MIGLTLRSAPYLPKAGMHRLIALATIGERRVSYEEIVENPDDDLEFLRRARDKFEEMIAGT